MDMKKKNTGLLMMSWRNFKGDDSFGKKMARGVVNTLNSASIRFSFIVVVNPYIHIQKFLIVHKFVSL